MDFASLMSAQISKSSGTEKKPEETAQKYQRQSEVAAAREAAYRAEQAARENDKLVKAEKKRRLDEKERQRKEEREAKRKKLAEDSQRRQEEETEKTERERRRRIGLPDLPSQVESNTTTVDETRLIENEVDLEDAELTARLRELEEPSVLFGEEHEGRLKRFYAIKRARERKKAILETKQKSAKQPVPTSLEPVEREDTEVEFTLPPTTDVDGRLMLARRLSTWLNMILYEWGLALDRRDESTKESRQGKDAVNSRMQALIPLKSLFTKLERLPSDPSVLPDDLLKPMVEIVVKAQQRQYVRANDAYLQLSIGKAAWPIGVTMVGIHERSSREKINEGDNKAHIMADEETRKILQSIKRCLTFAQTKWPPEDLGQLMG